MSEEIHIPKILFVDDEPDLEAMIRQRFRSRIRNGEMHVDFAVNGKDALEKINGDQKFDIIFTDINTWIPDFNSVVYFLAGSAPKL